MIIKGIGIDVVGISRFTGLKDENDFVKQIFTQREISVIPGHRRFVHLATVFALKEAVMKAFGWGLTNGSYWHDIELIENEQISLLGTLDRYAKKMRVANIYSTYSRSKNYVTAFVLLEGQKENT